MGSKKLTKISIPTSSMTILSKHLSHNEKEIIAMYETQAAADLTKIRFDVKARCASQVGIIDPSLAEDLIEVYEARNAIHIHAEIRKSLEYQLELSKRAYRRMNPFRKAVNFFLKARGI